VAIARFKDLSLGAGDPARLGAFWAAVLCRTWEAQENGDGLLRGPTPQHTVPAVAPLVEAGATVLREPGGDIHWHVLADSEGNEFCALSE